MKKGFTLIEVIVTLFILCMISTPIFDANFISYSTSENTKLREREYNITRSLCEIYKSETEVIGNKTVVIYINDLSEFTHSIYDCFEYGISVLDNDSNIIRNNNVGDKNFAVVMKSFGSSSFDILKVTTLSMKKADTGVTLRIAR